MTAKSPRRKLKKHQLREMIMEFLLRENHRAFNYKQISYGIGLTNDSNRMDVITLLDELVAADMLLEVSLGRYKMKENRGTEKTGYFIRRSTGKNAVMIDDEPIMVAERNSMHALNGDKVRVIISAARRGAPSEAQVVEILEAKEQTFVGTLKVERNYCALLPDSKYLAADIIIPRGKLKGGKTGDKAVVRITQWRDDEMNPRGEIIDILGRKGENNTEMHAILAEYGLPYKYPESIEKEALRIDAGITEEEISKREDFRGVTTFTIDPRDAKDFDDALSIRQLAGGNWEVGVHIADVTHYVDTQSNIEKEARKRATSVYLVDRTIPMLPEHLSNGICSLRPDEEKLCFSAIFEMNSRADVVNYRIGRTVIKSNRRFTYEEAQEIIEKGEGELSREILTLNDLAKKLRKRRFDNGALEFDRAEVRFEIDEKGHPTDVYFKVQKDANKLIEEFMLLANETVAAFIGKVPEKKKAKTFVYRVHAAPDAEKIAALAQIASRFGHKIKIEGSPKEVNSSINRLVKDVKGKGEENLISLLAIRSMAKAEYSVDNIGHYGLALKYYTHFTSPIRRYPDMMVHRMLAKYMSGMRSEPRQKTEELCGHSSDMEQLASNAERSSIRYKQVEYLHDRLGEEYEGIITGVTEWGCYVELNENKCEGLIPIRDLKDDYYDLDEKNYCLIGRKSHNRYTLGDRVKVIVARADVERRMVDFVPVEDMGNPDLRKYRASAKEKNPRNKGIKKRTRRSKR